MKTSDFFYDLPPELIAQTPIEPRNTSRLLVMDKQTGELNHTSFNNLSDFLNAGDCLVLNNTRVLPARLFGTREDTGSIVEFVLLKQRAANIWECLAGPGKKAKVGHQFNLKYDLNGRYKGAPHIYIYSDGKHIHTNEAIQLQKNLLNFELEEIFD